MKNNLLFVNHNQGIIREFLEAMKGYSIEIDTADKSEKVAALLKKKKYKVVITGMNLTGFDGSKIIAYLNQYCPQTVCMVYTGRLELVHLKLLVNERKVFRIFQKSSDFGGEVCNAVMDAFEYYDMQETKSQERQILEQKLKSARANVRNLEEGAMIREQEKQELAVFLRTMLHTYTQNVETVLNRKERKVLLFYEAELMNQLLKESCGLEEVLEVRKRIYEACDNAGKQKLQPIVERIHQNFVAMVK